MGVLINPGTADGRGNGCTDEVVPIASGAWLSSPGVWLSASGGSDEGVFVSAINKRLQSV